MERIIDVDLSGRAYPIRIAPGCRTQIGALIADRLGTCPALVIADDTVAGLYAQELLRSLDDAGIVAHLASFPAGEPSKNIGTCQQLWQACADVGLDRGGMIIALGGGVSGDIAGFIAATWMRGVPLVQIPTSLLAMVDSAVGGKTGVNLAAGKNLIGSFWQPSLVIIDPTYLTTMDDREFRAGLAEVAKYGVIREPDFFAWQEAHHSALVARDPEALAHAVAESCGSKAWYVVGDEHEHGVRAHLNYGHTFGHALERITAYRRYLHGEAVAIGMCMAVAAAENLGMVDDPDLAARQATLLAAYGLPDRHRIADPLAEADALLAACALDKKNRRGSARFILPRGIGRVEQVHDPDPAAIRAGFSAALATGTEP